MLWNIANAVCLFQNECWKRDVSCSFNPRLAMCYTCFREPHKAFQGREGEPVALVLSDQSFPANVPAVDDGECIRVMRVEDGSLN